jgi:pimeloyl-ACP methyl ester carboxylesterase
MTLTRAVCLLGCLAAVAGAAQASGRPAECQGFGIVCSSVRVPLDPTGKVKGTVSLHVEIDRAARPRGVMFLLAGGPGQASTDAFYIGRGSEWAQLFPGFTLVTFDPRGTGESGDLRCRSGRKGETQVDVIAACARALGTARDFYSTADNARDLDAVRRSLGFDRIGVLGVSYGTDVALTYARMFPTHVRRLVLDSVASPITALPLVKDVLDALPGTLDRFCAWTCGGVTADYALDVTSLGNSLAARPLHGWVLEWGKGRRLVTLTASRFIDVVIATDLDPGLAAEMPAAVHAALRHNPSPLLRLAELVHPRHTVLPPLENAVYLTTICNDGPVSWPTGASLADRRAALKAAEARIKGLDGRFGPWASSVGNAALCLGWPDSGTPPAAEPGPYPDVPLLEISGTLDMRSPTIEARAALAKFPHGHLLIVGRAGHSVLSNPTGCIRSAIGHWLEGVTVARGCVAPLPLAPIGAFPAIGSKAIGTEATLGRVGASLREAEAASLLAYVQQVGAIQGLAGGTLWNAGPAFDLVHYALAGDVALSGHFERGSSSRGSLSFRGILSVEQGGKTVGDLVLSADGLDGTLDGRPVTSSELSPAIPAAMPVPAWSAWAPPAGPVATAAGAIAAHVAPTYLAGAGGSPLVDVSQGPPRALGRLAVAVEVSAVGRSGPRFALPSTVWTYTLCGRASECSIPGDPSETRGRLVAREALELALYTFEYEPGIDSVLVYLPSVRGAGPPHEAMYFERNQVAGELARPLARTLPLASPPLPDDPDATEATRIDALTRPAAMAFRTLHTRAGPILYLIR